MCVCFLEALALIMKDREVMYCHTDTCVFEAPCKRMPLLQLGHCECKHARVKSRQAPVQDPMGPHVITCWQPAVITDLCSDSLSRRVRGGAIKRQIVIQSVIYSEEIVHFNHYGNPPKQLNIGLFRGAFLVCWWKKKWTLSLIVTFNFPISLPPWVNIPLMEL